MSIADTIIDQGLDIVNFTTKFTLKDIEIIIYFKSGSHVDININDGTLEIERSTTVSSTEMYQALVFTKLFNIRFNSVHLYWEYENDPQYNI